MFTTRLSEDRNKKKSLKNKILAEERLKRKIKCF